jgi:hypothetical protein
LFDNLRMPASERVTGPLTQRRFAPQQFAQIARPSSLPVAPQLGQGISVKSKRRAI